MSKNQKNTLNIWTEIFENAKDLSYSENPKTQNQLFELVKQNFLKTIFPQGNIKSLEVGCGAANTSLYFAKRGYFATCLDLNNSILDIAKTNFKKESIKANFVVGDAQGLPFKSNSFDLVMSFGLLEHFEDPNIAINEMLRVLKPGGFFFADIVPNRFSCQTIGNYFNFLASFLFGIFTLRPIKGIKNGLKNFYPLYYENNISYKKYQEIIKNAGIQKVIVRGNRPFPRLTLPLSLDRLYTRLLKPLIPLWKKFDKWDSPIARTWGAGLWFWGRK